jgi:hypothetical protein
MSELVPIEEGEREMTEHEIELQKRRAASLFFALLSGMVAVSSAVVPAILNI